MYKIVLRSIRDAELSGKRVLLRAGLNVPIGEDGLVADDFRLRQGLKTIEYLSSRGAKTVVIAHLGREGATLRPVIETLQRISHIPLSWSGLSVEAYLDKRPPIIDGGCLVLENIRREKGEEENDSHVAEMLARCGEIFVNDAFADSHRAHASIVGVAKLLPSYAGILMEQEIHKLSEALTPPTPSLAIMGGAKFETKQPLIDRLLPIYSEICIGGMLANDFLRAKGVSIGTSAISGGVPRQDLLHNPRVNIEKDCVVVTDGATRTIPINTIQAQDMIVDAGSETIQEWTGKINQAAFVLWNGPLGFYERGFTHATEAIGHAIIASQARAVIGGGDTIAVLEASHFDEERVFRSTGGGAMLQFLADGTLPGIEPLRA